MPRCALTQPSIALGIAIAMLAGGCEKRQSTVPKKPTTIEELQVYLDQNKTVSKGDYLKERQEAAERGDPKAQFDLGSYYYMTDSGHTEAVKWLKKAGEQNHAVAQHLLACSYAEGRGVPQDSVEAAKWLRKSAELGFVGAQWDLGLAYQKGTGVPKDAPESFKWFQMAANQGDAGAQYKLGIAYSKGIGTPKDDVESIKWFRKSADQNDADSQFMVGVAYEYGKGVIKDYSEAVRWYGKAAEQNIASAQFNLGNSYASGHGVPKDYVAAYMWYNLASVSGDAMSGETRDMIAKAMTQEQIAEGQRLSREWKPKKNTAE